MPDNAPWQKYKVGSPSTRPNWVESDCRELTEIYHVAHLEAAHRIIVDGKIRSGLVYDKSILNEERILVSWLSPNHWNDGSRYGPVRFTFDWKKLIEGHRAYWVESIPYKVHACRILLTTNDYSSHHRLIPYDPAAGDGPWWFDESTGTHYWNGDHCLEIMVERDIELADLSDLDCVKHHPTFCKINPQTCPERGLSSGFASARFLARLAGEGLELPASLRSGPEELDRVRYLPQDAMPYIEAQIVATPVVFKGVLTSESPDAAPVGRALLNAYAHPRLHSEIPVLASLFRTKEDALACCFALLGSVVGSSSPALITPLF